MTTFALTIGCADAATIYQVTTDNPEVCLAFLQQHDHEGSAVRLFITDEATWYDGVFDQEHTYAALDAWIAKQPETHGWGV